MNWKQIQERHSDNKITDNRLIIKLLLQKNLADDAEWKCKQAFHKRNESCNSIFQCLANKSFISNCYAKHILCAYFTIRYMKLEAWTSLLSFSKKVNIPRTRNKWLQRECDSRVDLVRCMQYLFCVKIDVKLCRTTTLNHITEMFRACVLAHERPEPTKQYVHAPHRPFYTLHPVHSNESLGVPGLSAILKIALFIQPAYKINSVAYFAIERQKLWFLPRRCRYT